MVKLIAKKIIAQLDIKNEKEMDSTFPTLRQELLGRTLKVDEVVTILGFEFKIIEIEFDNPDDLTGVHRKFGSQGIFDKNSRLIFRGSHGKYPESYSER
jgi:hypothetical protein